MCCAWSLGQAGCAASMPCGAWSYLFGCWRGLTGCGWAGCLLGVACMCLMFFVWQHQVVRQFVALVHDARWFWDSVWNLYGSVHRWTRPKVVSMQLWLHVAAYLSVRKQSIRMFNWPWGLANHVGNQLSNSTSIPSKPFTPEQSVGATLTLIVCSHRQPDMPHGYWKTPLPCMQLKYTLEQFSCCLCPFASS